MEDIDIQAVVESIHISITIMAINTIKEVIKEVLEASSALIAFLAAKNDSLFY